MLTHPIKALIAEDNFLVTEMIRGLLLDLGHNVIGAAVDGRQAVELTQLLKPEVVIMDLEMPHLDGLAATRRIQELCPTPIVVLSAYETPELLEQAGQAGVGAYLVKPPKAREMERAIVIAMARFEDLLALRRLRAELVARASAMQESAARVETLTGLLPICPSCRRRRDDPAYWRQVEAYLDRQPIAELSPAQLCPQCAASVRPLDSQNVWPAP